MNPRERVLLNAASASLLSYISAYTVIAIVQAFAFTPGAFMVLFCSSVVIFMRKETKTLASWAIFAVTIITFILSTAYCAADLSIIIVLVKFGMKDTESRNFEESIVLATVRTVLPNLVALWASLVLPVISDAVVVWRAWVLFYRQHWLMYIPLLLLVGTISVTLVYGSLMSQAYSSFLRGQSVSIGDADSRFFGASIILSLITNVVTTLMFMYQLWDYQKATFKAVGHTRSQSSPIKVISLLVESGVAYCALQIIALILDAVPKEELGTPRVYAAQIFLSAYTVLSAIYPTLVIFLINTRHSIADSLRSSQISLGMPIDPQRLDESPVRYTQATGLHAPVLARLSFSTSRLHLNWWESPEVIDARRRSLDLEARSVEDLKAL